MSEMTTKALITWSFEQAELCRSDYPRPDLADMHEAIAARLKALEEALRWYQQQCTELAIPIGVDLCEAAIEARAVVSDDAFMELQLDGGKRARAILDAAREVE